MNSVIRALVNQGDKSQPSASLRSKSARHAGIAFLVGALVLLLPPPARSTMTLNSAGAGGAPLTVGTSAAVQVLAAGSRANWSLESESGDLRCAFGDSLNNPPNPEPTATVGFLIPYVKGQVWKESGANAVLRLDCIAVTSSTSVDTAEDK
jgi:hypothetical protein